MAESLKGEDLPRFQSLQLDFAAHIRNPELNPIPDGIEQRRMAIYARLFYNNIESFCAMRFRRTKAILGEERWHRLIRDFVHRHQSKSPYFAQISEEFIAYLAVDGVVPGDLPFILELCHYEWLPLYLDRLIAELPIYKSCPDPLTATLQTSELVQIRRYTWPVNKLSQNFQPSVPPSTPTWVLGFRNRADKVDLKHTDAFTATLLTKLTTPMQTRDAVCDVLGVGVPPTEHRWEQIAQRLDDLIELDVLLVRDQRADLEIAWR